MDLRSLEFQERRMAERSHSENERNTSAAVKKPKTIVRNPFETALFKYSWMIWFVWILETRIIEKDRKTSQRRPFWVLWDCSKQVVTVSTVAWEGDRFLQNRCNGWIGDMILHQRGCRIIPIGLCFVKVSNRHRLLPWWWFFLFAFLCFVIVTCSVNKTYRTVNYGEWCLYILLWAVETFAVTGGCVWIYFHHFDQRRSDVVNPIPVEKLGVIVELACCDLNNAAVILESCSL